MTMRILCIAVLSVALSGTAAPRAQAPAGEWFTLTKIAFRVFAAIDDPKAKQRAYSNAGFVIGEDGVIVIDTLTGDAAAGHLLKQIRALTPLPVTSVVNTHYHGDHVAGNRIFSDAGARILAHRNVHRWIYSENLRMLGDKPNPDLITYIKRFVAPTIGYTGAVDLYSGSRLVQVRSFPGHTGGDSVIIVPDAKVVFAGDLLWKDMLPNTVDGSTVAWIQTLDTLSGTYADYTFIPGHGPVATAKDVTAFRDYLTFVQRLVADARATGKSGNALTQAVLPTLEQRYGTWEGFEYLAARNIEEAAAEQAGTKRIPQP
jgi:glyoxylase-like metal-dependent hydrolase (beta-lactamase superfamily II)